MPTDSMARRISFADADGLRTNSGLMATSPERQASTPDFQGLMIADISVVRRMLAGFGGVLR
ncbi:MAG: hypothetical protein OXG06_06890 [Gammaproteobacteria bacterium]|nr:hypothetical protein [Gammaproteobacteria bacterium]